MMRNNRNFVFGLYVAIVCLTLAFQTYIRLPQCAGTTTCAVSLGKGAIWSAAWPAYWGIFAYGWVNSDEQADQAQNAAVDAEWYLSQYPDVRAAVQDGRFKSAEDHYRNNGFKEKRLPAKPKVDEEFYLRTNPDVAAAVRSGQFKSGYEHYVTYGYLEGRKPSP
jgi:hypothetical protein